MGTLSIFHWLILAIVAATVTIPFMKILPRAGIPGWVGIFGIVPVVPLVFLWVLALKTWPSDQDKSNQVA